MKQLKRILVCFLVIVGAATLLAGTPQEASAAAKSNVLIASATAKSSTSVKVTWKKVPGATRYVIKSAPCGSDRYKTVKTLKKSSTSFTKKKLNPKKTYKYMVAAQKKSGGKYVTIAKSKIIHVATSGNKVYTNPKGIKLKQTKLSLNVGKSKKLKATVTKQDPSKRLLDKHTSTKIRFVSSNPSVAKVNGKGKITAVGAGSCKIYALAINGFSATCKVTVKSEPKEETTTQPEAAPVPAPEPKSHTLTYQYTGTVPDGAPAVPASATYKTGDTVKKAAVPELEGYTFSGWEGEVTTMPDKDVTVTGTWEKKTITVTYYCPNPAYFNSEDTYSDDKIGDEFDKLASALAESQESLQTAISKAEYTLPQVLQIISWSQEGISVLKKSIESGSVSEEYVAAAQAFIPTAESIIKALEDYRKDTYGEEYLTYTQTLTYGDTAEKLLTIDQIESFCKACADYSSFGSARYNPWCMSDLFETKKAKDNLNCGFVDILRLSPEERENCIFQVDEAYTDEVKNEIKAALQGIVLKEDLSLYAGWAYDPPS